jgi:hypothetical protein
MHSATRVLAIRRIALQLALTLLILPGAARAQDVVSVWQRWERALISGKQYANPCTDVQVRVRLDGPKGATRMGMAFWDGGDRFVIRCSFPAPGEWRWATTCSDTSNRGLHGKSGTVHVTAAWGTNPLTQHGYPRVSDDRRTLAYADGTRFPWIGDTCWAAPVLASERDWQAYVANRAAKGYTVLQLSIAPDWALERSKDEMRPFLSKLPDITKPNPAYFQQMDRMLAAANDQGLFVMMCGLMETPYRYPPPDQVAVLSRYVAARYSSFAVAFSPSFDSGIHEAETVASANAVREAAPANLITMHMGTGVGPRFHAAEWLSFDMYQSGHNGGDARRQSSRATGMPAEILALPGRKPIVNGEAIYEGDLGGAYDVRRTAWLSFLSGAVGYTAGINQIYAWKEDAIAKMNVPSSDQIALLARLLRVIPWWSLEPAPKRILNQPDDRARLMAFAMTSDKALGIAYLPANATIDLDLTGCRATYDARWVNPATGHWRAGTAATASQRTTLTAPDERDWVLVLAAPDSATLAQVKSGLDAVAYRKSGSVATIAFDKDAAVDGLVRKEPGDGEFVRASVDGVPCIVNENPRRNAYLYIDVDDRLVFRGGVGRMTVEIRLQTDEPLDGLQLQYDATGVADVSNVYRSVPPSSRTQDGRWTKVLFDTGAPYLGNRQNSGADMRLFLNGHRCNVASLRVTLGDVKR